MRAECQLINDCCMCEAWPKVATAPSCPNINCCVPSCTSHKLGNVKARCINNVCQLAL